MSDLRTRYLGLELANPLVPSASPLSRDLDASRRLEDAGASAIVMYSLFEEELRQEEEQMLRFIHEQAIGHGEAQSFLPQPDVYFSGLEQYLEQLTRLKAALSIPIIASLNGVSLSGWVAYGHELEAAGADALELNVYYIAADIAETGQDVENRYVELVRELRTQVNIPITVKLSAQFSAIANMVQRLDKAGASGVSLFNRFYQPDIDLDAMKITPSLQLSTSAEARLAMRWIAMLHGRVRLSLAATGGIHTGEDALKMLLAGADVTHLCSVLLQQGPEYLGVIKRELDDWLDSHEYDSVAQLKGSMSYQHAADPAAFERVNYLHVLNSYKPAPGVLR